MLVQEGAQGRVPLGAGSTAEHDADRARRTAQRRLAREVTAWVHGPEAARKAEVASEVMFGGALEDLGDADLEPLLADVLAAAIGTSHRMLIYHFGSREGLVAAIVASVEAPQESSSRARSRAAAPRRRRTCEALSRRLRSPSPPTTSTSPPSPRPSASFASTSGESSSGSAV